MPRPAQDAAPPDNLINTAAGRKYWQDAAADDNGMLGGIPSLKGSKSISQVDLQGSRTFLARLGIGAKGGRKPIASALDGGAGIGRVTQGVLLRVAEQVDVVEPISKFTEALSRQPGVRNIFNVGLEEWQPLEGVEYDLIWMQWCLGHLTDDEVIAFLRVCKTVLRAGTGVIVAKENMATGGVDAYDETDSSVTRQDEKFRSLFEGAGLKLVRTDIQRGFSDSLLPVRMYALKPL